MKLKSIYINNYRCLQNFALDLERADVLLILGRNGMGKTTVLDALKTLHEVVCGGCADALFSRRDFAFGQIDTPIRLEFVMEIEGVIYDYALALSWSQGTDAITIAKEELKSGDTVFFSRNDSQVCFLAEGNVLQDCPIGMNHFLLTLFSGQDRCGIACEAVRSFINRWLLVSPWPSSITTDFTDKCSCLSSDASNFLSWFRTVIVQNVGFTNQWMEYLRSGCFDRLSDLVWTDLMKDRENEMIFSMSGDSQKILEMRFSELSDGEKIFVIGAALMTYNAVCGGTFCFWDEPDNFLAVSEVQDFVTRLRKAFGHGRGQLMITSHNIETIRTVGMDATVIMRRLSHLEPARIQSVSDLLKTRKERSDYIQEILTGDIYGL